MYLISFRCSYSFVDRLCMSQSHVTTNIANMPIPVDVLLEILDYVVKAGLATMCRVNKICCSCSQDILYRDIYVETPKVQQTLAQSTHLARRVRSFDSCYNNRDLAMALWNMTSLRILKLPIGIHMKILDGCTFKLDSFECAHVHNYNQSLENFLSSQPSLKCVTFHTDFSSTVSSSLEATFLPNLTRINATFPWLPYLIPGRPLSEVISTGYTFNKHPIDFSFFALSTTPIKKLTIDYSFLYSTPGRLLASFLPSLTHFTLTVLRYDTPFKFRGVSGLYLYNYSILSNMAQFGLDIDDWIENMLAAFASLRVFTIELTGNQPYPSEIYLRYITTASCQAPHLEYFTIHHGNFHTVRCKRVNANWVVCEYPAP